MYIDNFVNPKLRAMNEIEVKSSRFRLNDRVIVVSCFFTVDAKRLSDRYANYNEQISCNFH